jgi:peptidoglycan/xylan/chitin deacetylase (PgdA/CDA1 family)
MYEGSFSWPHNAQVAVVLSVAWETPDDDYGSNESREGSDRRPLPKDALYQRDTWAVLERRFAELGGLQRVLSVFDRNDVKASFYVNGMTVETFPELARQVNDAGHDIASQSYTHGSSIMFGPEDEHRRLRQTAQLFESVLGKRPKGYAPSGGRHTPATLSILAAEGYIWSGSYRNVDLPYVTYIDDTPIVCMNNYMLNDRDSYTGVKSSARALLDSMRDEVDFLALEGARGYPKMTSFGVHPFLCRAFRMKPYEEFIQYLKEKEGVWIATRTEIAQHVLTNFPDMTLSRLYPNSLPALSLYGFEEISHRCLLDGGDK